jgi:hypothetical protein
LNAQVGSTPLTDRKEILTADVHAIEKDYNELIAQAQQLAAAMRSMADANRSAPQRRSSGSNQRGVS